MNARRLTLLALTVCIAALGGCVLTEGQTDGQARHDRYADLIERSTDALDRAAATITQPGVVQRDPTQAAQEASAISVAARDLGAVATQIAAAAESAAVAAQAAADSAEDAPQRIADAVGAVTGLGVSIATGNPAVAAPVAQTARDGTQQLIELAGALMLGAAGVGGAWRAANKAWDERDKLAKGGS